MTNRRVALLGATIIFGGIITLNLGVTCGSGLTKPQTNKTRRAVFPSVEIVAYESSAAGLKVRPNFSGAVVTLRIKNNGKSPSVPTTFTLKDRSGLLRQATEAIPSLPAGGSQLRKLELSANQSGPTPSAWPQRYRENCGPELVSVLDVGEMPRPVPRNLHAESGLVFQTGSGLTAQPDPYRSICDSTQCLKPCAMARDIRRQLDGHVVGYSFFVGLDSEYGAGGDARTVANGMSRNFTTKTNIEVASVSKLVTAIAAIRILDLHEVHLDDHIGPYFPSDWSVSSYVRDITFAQLLSQSSGIKEYGNFALDYATLKTFFTQSVNSNSTAGCGKANDPPSDQINPNDQSRCYSNINFAIFRILLPKVAGLRVDPDQATRPQTLADQYQSLVRDNVFSLVGVEGVSCAPPTDNPGKLNYALAYRYPGSDSGVDPGDWSLRCGGAGWHLSVEDLAKVLLSINARDGKILAETPANQQFEEMRLNQFAWDIDNSRRLEKNGGFKSSCDSNHENCKLISTSASIFGPVTGPRLVAILFLNSNISGGAADGNGARAVVKRAYDNSLFPKP